ncbi:2'-5' RNA ligase family protein [Pseudonocardia sp. N23]|uniref:2'-5' RNA ligase family protein n=1 Tax=Pseudonocardia sp. N23 TaxID=1987376 RepID=UPI000BFB652B|nr:2'-5' RNA ligase family protein [Pseudonocardia sp. N23]
MADALIVTAVLDDAAQERFDALRRAHFPPARNRLAAHVTLFHALPGEHRRGIEDDLGVVAGRMAATVPVTVTGLRFTGYGVSYVLRSPALTSARSGLARRWEPWLSAQDRAKAGDLHVTVQNKVEPEEARALHDTLRAEFVPSQVTSVGLALWRYLDGPWEELGRVPFGAPAGGPTVSGPTAGDPAVSDPTGDAGPARRTSGSGRARTRRRAQG